MKNPKTGDVYRFPLGDGTYGFGLIVDPYDRIFRLRTSRDVGIDEVLSSGEAFVCSLSFGSTKDKAVERIGHIELDEAAELAKIKPFYRYPYGRGRDYVLVQPGNDSHGGRIVERKDCIGLRKSSVAGLDGLIQKFLDETEDRFTIWRLLYGPLRPDFNIDKWEEDSSRGEVRINDPAYYLDYQEKQEGE